MSLKKLPILAIVTFPMAIHAASADKTELLKRSPIELKGGSMSAPSSAQFQQGYQQGAHDILAHAASIGGIPIELLSHLASAFGLTVKHPAPSSPADNATPPPRAIPQSLTPLPASALSQLQAQQQAQQADH